MRSSPPSHLRPRSLASTGPGADLEAQAARRFRTIYGFVAVAMPLSGVLRAVARGLGAPIPDEALLWGSIVSITTTLAALALRVLSRPGGLSVATQLRLAAVFEVVLCAAGSAMERAFLGFGDLPVRLPVASVLLVLFPVIAPLPLPRRQWMTAASVAAVLFGVFSVSLFTRPLPGPSVLLATLGPVFGTAFVGLAAARVVLGLTEQVERARRAGAYELEDKLGDGGMGEVWRARHRWLARPAAIKRVRLDGGPGLAERFMREAQATAALRSPHTVELYDFGVADDGSFYYAMELLEGFDLDRLVRRFGPLPAERVVHVLRQVCRSLAEAEQRGLVHRDIKPANLFVGRLGAELDFVKVLDFGLVKARDLQGVPTEAGLTADQTVVVGTPAFLSPEAALGRPVDHRADLYALGCVAVWLLTGELVFGELGPMEAVIEHVKTAPVAPSLRTELPIPPALDALVLDCLAKAPDDRPPSALAVVDRLDAIPLEARWTEARARAWWGLHGPEAGGASSPAGSGQATL